MWLFIHSLIQVDICQEKENLDGKNNKVLSVLINGKGNVKHHNSQESHKQLKKTQCFHIFCQVCWTM